MADTIYRDTWAEVDLEAIAYNIGQIKRKLPDRSDVIAVVKADGYGHGAVEVAKKALESGAAMLAVALFEEALKLREANINAPILVFGRVAPKDTPLAAEKDITLTFFQKDWLQEVKQHSFHTPLKLHMKWDTGMGRVGIRTEEELRELVEELHGLQQIHLTGVYTHFATADEPELAYFEKQHTWFKHLLSVFNSIWTEPTAFHIGNSAASIRFPERMHHYIRFGISMYGLYPSGTVRQEERIDLKPAFSLHSRLIHVKKVEPGESISYGATYTSTDHEWIGTIPIGYADGWIRKLQGMDVLIDGKRMPIAGRICMDQTMIKLDKEYSVGTEVTLIGKQGNEVIEVDEIAAKLETITYEIPCMISSRVPRVYKGSIDK
ncbi:alanine racemase [Virgibacillus doumboii]|uniref:alanine racemase n=1 Tax=Virgibacillus doumboii TaxID=2697503 RepID=UPI0013DF8F17|nr:alanine racemase [Virgibacillus doumboii]